MKSIFKNLHPEFLRHLKFGVCYIIIFPLFITTPESSYAEKNSTINENCLACHNKRNQFKIFENDEKIEVYVNSEKYLQSAHKNLKCSECHVTFTDKNHPERRYRTYNQYKIMSSHVCNNCHYNILNEKTHKNFINKKEYEDFLICTNCHSPHYTVTGDILYSERENDKKYCLSCHSKGIEIKFLNNEKLSIKFNMQEFKNSVHSEINCTECHFGFSQEYHPIRYFKNRRNLSVANAEVCRRCHFDKYTMYQDSIHSQLLSKGDERVPLCTNCHGYHGIQKFGKERVKITKKCGECHKEVYEVYAKSIHGYALFDEHNKDVPNCIDCHTSHKIEDPLSKKFTLHIPEMCGKCHSNEKIMNKYGLSTQVVSTYLSDFHGKRLSIYLNELPEISNNNNNIKEIATCVNCHGIHNITSTRTLDKKTLKEKLVKACKKCHHNVTLNFTDAWLSHYIPTFQKNPSLFIILWGYKIFIIALVIGILLQVLLSIWRYAISR